MTARTLTPAQDWAKTAKSPFPGESDAYRKARQALLAEEIEFRRQPEGRGTDWYPKLSY